MRDSVRHTHITGFIHQTYEHNRISLEEQSFYLRKWSGLEKHPQVTSYSITGMR